MPKRLMRRIETGSGGSLPISSRGRALHQNVYGYGMDKSVYEQTSSTR